MLQKSPSEVGWHRFVPSSRRMQFIVLYSASIVVIGALLGPIPRVMHIQASSLGYAAYVLVSIVIAAVVAFALLRVFDLYNEEQVEKAVEKAVAETTRHERAAAANNLLHVMGGIQH